MRSLVALSVVLLLCAHSVAAIERFDRVSIQGLAPNGVIAQLSGDDAYLGLGSQPPNSLNTVCNNKLDGSIVVLNSGGSLSNLPQLATCYNGDAYPFGGAGNVESDYVLAENADPCPTDYRIGQIFDAAGFFKSSSPVIANCNPGTQPCPNRVIVANTGPKLQFCSGGSCAEVNYNQVPTITAVLDIGGSLNQSNINAIRFEPASDSDRKLCVWNKAKIQFFPVTGLTAPPSADQVASTCAAQGLFPASTASLYKNLHSGFDTANAISLFYLRSIEYAAAYAFIEDDCFPTDGSSPVGDIQNYYAPMLYIATYDSCPYTTNIPVITRTLLGQNLDTTPLITNDNLWENSIPFSPDLVTEIDISCSDASVSPTLPPWPGISQIVMMGEGPLFEQWTTSLPVTRDGFYTGAFAACSYENDFVIDQSPIKCTGPLPEQVECTFTQRTTCTTCCFCTSGCAADCNDCCGTQCTTCNDEGFPATDCNRNPPPPA